ncbi:hypothetical protein [Massilia aquatica]|uniref:Uncharacterized protein n=1 Tax=Massilia aquatica TaxID=2609000 RepID=A0ABX0ML81_9BURK|nr:hypothetical protein [Massilia aquatica]NHZ44269.1 hypothetical protein [Massilia aquatica]
MWPFVIGDWYVLKTEQAEVSMNLVYRLTTELRKDPSRVASVREISADTSRPNMGLKEGFGLFDSDEWWGNVKNGNLRGNYVSGVIEHLSHAGQDEDDDINSFIILLNDGSTRYRSIYCNNRCDAELFRLGCRVDIFSVFVPVKNSRAPGLERDFSEMVIEMAVSTMPLASILEVIED